MFIDKMKFRIEFTVNRLTIKLEHRAVAWAGEGNNNLERVLFPIDKPLRALKDVERLKLR